MRRTYSTLTACILSLALLAGCAENPATGGQTFSLVSRAHEREIGQQTAQAFLKTYGLYKPASKTTKYVEEVCQRMFAVTELAHEPLSCILLDSPEFNAWATPGYINVYRGFLPFIHTEAELAAVLGHEAGHITGRHVAQRATSGIVAGALVTALGIYISTQNDNAGPAAQAAMQVGSLAAGVAISKFGRDHEREADMLAQRYLPRAGYDARAAAMLVQSMQAHEAYMNKFVVALRGNDANKTDLLTQLTSSHPATAERLHAAIHRHGPPDGSVQLPEGITPATPPTDPMGQHRFLEAINGMAYGPQRAWGIAGRNYIALPQARAIVRLPDGFVSHYLEGPEKPDENGVWVGRHAETDVRFRLGWDKYTAGMNVGNLLGQLKVENIQRLQLADGTVAYTGTRQSGAAQPAFRAVAIPSLQAEKVVIIVFSFPNVAARNAEEGAIMTSLTQSKILSEEAADRLQPLKLAIHTVSAGDTFAKLANRLPMGALRDDLFSALNNLPPTSPLKVGSKVKLIVDGNGV